ncbi:CRISPR-associated endonuclease/helicase Cas3 [Janthinobacterium sp. CG_23.3]|uniref:CRISPR-associated helicase Cas3' n=1 Tax=Janthinobacterium sp. CG_23.3 TaxID=3349634 RepID=UPI0038D46579
MNQADSYFLYWGKAKPAADCGPQYHLLPFHSLDVAAVGVAYLRQSGSLLRSCCQFLHCTEDVFLSWAAFFLALHDLGKFSEAFQSQRPDLIQHLQNRAPNPAKQYDVRHDSLGYWLWKDDLARLVSPNIGLDCSHDGKAAVVCWMRAVTGHHGMPPISNGSAERFFLRGDKQAAAEYTMAMAQLLLSDEAKNIATGLDGKAFLQASEILSWWFAGVTVLADWLGSNTTYFPYHDAPQELAQYWPQALGKAADALSAAGVLPASVQPGQSLQDFFPYIENPSPLQYWAATVPIPPAPQIYLLEDVTGAGKTEAAMMLAYRLMAEGLAEGFFIGLPTMATANAMYKRVAGVYQRLFAGDANLVLAHGHKGLVDEFARSVLPADSAESDPAQLDETASARCSAWLADHSKRALLASAGVGTIDQALLAVLHSKHQSLRLIGLFNKVLVVDEVHACDAYMQGLLEVLLEFHARADGSVILLSATLPSKMKQALLNAFARGRNQARAPALQASAYPLATRWHDGQQMLMEEPLASRANVSRTVQVHYEADQTKVFDYVRGALAQGKCVGWIRNTVADAMSAYACLAPTLDEGQVILFHARFAMSDRLAKEEQVLECFGEKSNHDVRRGRLMIATQVAEQSLDVDFDILLTDLAPIDRVLQRAGRLHRHIRDVHGNRLLAAGAVDGRPAPCLWVVGPQWVEHPRADWYGELFPKAQYVYPHHGQLWLTARILLQGRFSMPADARSMIEAVFSGDEEIPLTLEKSALEAEGQVIADLSVAQQNTLKVDGGYIRGDQGDWWSEAKTPSRLGEETREVMLAKWIDDELYPWVDGAWAYSMVKIAARQISEEALPVDAGKQATLLRLKQTLPSQGKWCLLLPLSLGPDGVWRGQAWAAGNARSGTKPALVTWLYDADFGLRMEASDAVGAASD